MDDLTRKTALSRSVADGALASVMGSLTGGVFLVGYALKVLHVGGGIIGILAALPLFANIVQIAGSLMIESTGKRKAVAIGGLLVGRLLWLAIIILPLVMLPGGPGAVAPLVVVIGLSSLFGSLGSVGWTAWISELVPEKKRGVFFGRRNMVASLTGMIATLAGGRFLDVAVRALHVPAATGFAALFAAGLLFGLGSAWFLSRIPEAGTPPARRSRREEVALILEPLRNRSFLALITFVSVWSVGVQMAGPFYSVFLIDTLRADFGTITVFSTCASIATLLMMRTWGPISDALGNKPVIIVSGWALVLVPILWIMARPQAFFLPVLLANLVSGAFMAGAALSQFNILIKLSPREGRSMYIALFSAITGLVGAVAPIAGGYAARALRDVSFTVLSYRITNLHLVFLASSAIQLASILLALRITEPASAAPIAVVLQLKNDLNPQAGIASSADFVMLELRRGKGVLRIVDEKTDALARRSEERIGALVDRLASATRGVRQRMRKLWRDEDEGDGPPAS